MGEVKENNKEEEIKPEDIQIILPTKRGRGRRSKAQEKQREDEMQFLAKNLLAFAKTIKITVSSRGWAYLLEGKHLIDKSEFDYAEKVINDLRKDGYIPINFCAVDKKREFKNNEKIDKIPESAYDFLLRKLRFIKKIDSIKDDVSFWKTQKYYVQMIVEKIDLVSLFESITRKYHVRIANAGGWSDLNTRDSLIENFRIAEELGLKPILFYYGDIDPSGIFIIKKIKDTLNRLVRSTNWRADNLKVVKVGLTDEFVSKHTLSWIDNLITGSGKDLADPKHNDHNKPYVQDYIKKYGTRKCEANAILPIGDEAIADLEKYLKKYINLDETTNKKYHDEIRKTQDDVRELMDKINFKETISELIEKLEETQEETREEKEQKEDEKPSLKQMLTESIEKEKAKENIEILVKVSSLGTEIEVEAKRCENCQALVELEKINEHKCPPNMITPIDKEKEEIKGAIKVIKKAVKEVKQKEEIKITKEEKELIDQFYETCMKSSSTDNTKYKNNKFFGIKNKEIDYIKVKKRFDLDKELTFNMLFSKYQEYILAKSHYNITETEKEETDRFYRDCINTAMENRIKIIDENFRTEENDIDYVKLKKFLKENNLELTYFNLFSKLPDLFK